MSFAFEESHGWMVGQVFMLKADTTNPNSPLLKAGTRVKVVMVSRFGDCGITTNLKADKGYSNRVMPFELKMLDGLTYIMSVKGPEGYMKEMGVYGVAPQLSLDEIQKLHDARKW